MRKLVAYRILFAIPILVLLSLLVFSTTYLVPGSPAAAILGTSATPERIAEVEAQLGLDRPFLDRLGEFLGGVATGDLGSSYRSGRSVTDLFAERLPATLSLVLGGITVALVIGIAVGTFAGARPGTLRDRVASIVTSVGVAIPEFWLGLVLLLVFAVQLGWLPVISYTPFTSDPVAWARGMLLPSLALGIGSAAIIARQTRAAMVRALASPYVDTLTAAGVSRRRIVYRYALKNAMVPVLATTGIVFSIMIGASFVVEKVFAIPGVGSLLLTSVPSKDLPIIQGGALVIGLIVIFVNLLTDVGYGLLNPQARPQ